ncbi:MAG: hypothetical protein HOZ81_46830 [Streptomyces sp.]|nr:hypothetical protein [Streptomyces sp.]NUS24437.1 hypothetical protein [Streptomyces sp.]
MTVPHAVVVLAVTDSAHLYSCRCGITGPLRPLPTEAEQDGRDHLNHTIQETAA